MSSTPTLDDVLNDLPLFSRPSSLSEEAPRLNAQCVAILERLRRGRASNSELSAIALNYTARISDLRRAGIVVRCVDRDRKTGTSYYELQQG